MTKNNEFIYPELSYKIIGILYTVHNQVGYGHKESYYQKAISYALKDENISFKEQVYSPLVFQNRIIGKYFLDFLIDEKIILEIKKDAFFRKQNIDQVYSYLKTCNLKLGILANFTSRGVKIKRIVNIK
jgi:GxxExxY protein